MKMELNHLLDEVKGDGSRIYYRKVPGVPVHVLIGDGVTYVFIRFTFGKEYKFPVLSCKGITSKSDIHTFTLMSSYRDSDLLLGLAADLLQPNNRTLFEDYQEEKYVVWLRHQLLRWISYYRSNSDGVMGKEKQLGLLGELNTLLNYLRDGNSLSCWRGPYGDHHDFHCESHHREVKSRLVTSKEVIKINGVEQLHYNGELFLSILHFIEHNNGESLYDLIEQITPFLSVDELHEFYDLLSFVGELPSEETSHRFVLLTEDVYSVQEGFPRQPFVDGTMEVNYKLPLMNLKEHLIEHIEIEANVS
ncbi:PD-(D/E)XK motif protein [Cytobacillus praedii]|uniref:PD-(D/E)XK motif protein n=1 Tax=Cytobacillus praedii TaxID=1742358 RepID=UPI003F7D197E